MAIESDRKPEISTAAQLDAWMESCSRLQEGRQAGGPHDLPRGILASDRSSKPISHAAGSSSAASRSAVLRPMMGLGDPTSIAGAAQSSTPGVVLAAPAAGSSDTPIAQQVLPGRPIGTTLALRKVRALPQRRVLPPRAAKQVFAPIPRAPAARARPTPAPARQTDVARPPAVVKNSGKMHKALCILRDPASLQAAREKMAQFTCTKTRRANADSVLSRYMKMAQESPWPVGTVNSFLDCIAVSMEADYNTVTRSITAAMADPKICRVTDGERKCVEDTLRMLQRRGHVDVPAQKVPLTAVHALDAYHRGLVTRSDLAVLLLTFFGGLRKSEVPRLDLEATQTKGTIWMTWEDSGDLKLHFRHSWTKSGSLYQVSRVRCICKELPAHGLPGYSCICKQREFLCAKARPLLDVHAIMQKMGFATQSTHSWRIGCCNWLYQCQTIPFHLLLVHCRWASTDLMLRYLRGLPETSPQHYRKIAFCSG
ncbi:unnamed protein product [Amoebophrya sp. A120]|nr:unnamed protein product [Amoebophrya sp. A120]|eukprot:GSA120T00012308001.1